MTGALIVILGNIASGKTTLASSLARHLDAPLYLEQPVGNEFLQRFSGEPARWCLANQTSFALEAFASSLAAIEGGVMDHSLEEVIPIHSSVFLDSGWLDDSEFGLLERLATSLELNRREPDLYVVLEASPETSMKRVKSRNRHVDKYPDASYLKAVSAAREDFLLSSSVRQIRFSSEEVDFREAKVGADIASLVSMALSDLSA